jgi:hypothetical protein
VTHVIDVDVLIRRVDESLALLRDRYSRCASGGGWYHELDIPEPGFTATAVGLLAFTENDQHFENFDEGLAFLAAGQVTAPDDPLLDGGWPVKSSRGRPVVEATAWIARFLARARCGAKDGAPDLDRAYRWLLGNQNHDGGWGSLRGDSSRVWLTCLCLRALAASNPYCPAIEAGVEWLMANRAAPGPAWGEIKTRPATVTHTAFVLLTLTEARPGREDNRLLMAYDWLKNRLAEPANDDRHSWIEIYDTSPDPHDPHRSARLALWHYGLPVSLAALLHDPRGIPTGFVCNAFDTIVRTGVEDPWPGYPGRSTSLWSVWWCLEALLKLKELRLIQPGHQIIWLEDAVVLRRASARDRPLRELLPRRRIQIKAALRRRWTVLLLAMATILGFIGVATDAWEWKDMWLGLLFPSALVGLQEILNRKRPANTS